MSGFADKKIRLGDLVMRNKAFDAIRGFAIVLMILANIAPHYANAFPFYLRLAFSLPAPMFVLISGLMLALGTNKHPFSYFLKRALFIVCIAALIDVGIHQEVPFESFDVLYLIGFSMPLVAIALRLNSYVHFLLIVGCFISGDWIRWNFGYTPLAFVDTFSMRTLVEFLLNPNIKLWIVNGDFPMLPWTGIMLFGGLVGKLFVTSNHANYFQSKNFIGIFLGLLLSGSLLLIFSPSPEFFIVRGYVEIFYPAYAAVLIALMSFTLFVLILSPYLQNITILNELGRSSLAIYAFHLALIELVATVITPITSLFTYFLVFVCLLAIVLLFSHTLVIIKNKYKNLPTLVIWLIGT